MQSEGMDGGVSTKLRMDVEWLNQRVYPMINRKDVPGDIHHPRDITNSLTFLSNCQLQKTTLELGQFSSKDFHIFISTSQWLLKQFQCVCASFQALSEILAYNSNTATGGNLGQDLKTGGEACPAKPKVSVPISWNVCHLLMKFLAMLCLQGREIYSRRMHAVQQCQRPPEGLRFHYRQIQALYEGIWVLAAIGVHQKSWEGDDGYEGMYTMG